MLKKLISRKNWIFVANCSLALLAIVLAIIAWVLPKWIVEARETAFLEEREELFFEAGFKVQQKARPEGTKAWNVFGVPDAKVGDIVQFQTEYQNWSKEAQEHVIMSLSWLEGLEFVPGSVKLYNAAYPDGLPVQDPTLTYYDGGGAGFAVDLGSYAEGANAFLRFSTVVTEVDATASGCFAAVKNGNTTLSSATSVGFAKTAKR